jgi:hypothetical protein
MGIWCLSRQVVEPAKIGLRTPCRKALKGRPKMRPFLQAASISMPPPTGRQRRHWQTEDLVYQGVTVAAILLVLGSLF